MSRYSFLVIIAILGLVSISAALPTTGNPSDITNNQANITCTGVSGSTAWITFGQTPNGQVWRTENFTASGGTSLARVWGSPLRSGTMYYAKCCDDTGCTASAKTFTTLAITQLTQPPIDAGWNNLTSNHFNIMYVPSAIFLGLTSIVPMVVFFGITLGFIVLGYWRANRTVRYVSVLFIIVGLILLTRFDTPGTMRSLGVVFLATALAGIILSFIRK
jgi:hypothetical protein